MPAHHRRTSAHDGDWRCRCRNPKRIKPLTLLLLEKHLFKETPRKTAPAGPATGCPESGHCSPPEWARRRAERSWGFGWVSFFLLHKVCCVLCVVQWDGELCIQFSVSCLSSLVFCWTSNNAARGWVWRGAAGRGLSRSRAETCASVYIRVMGAKTFHNDNTCLLSRRLYGITSSLLVISLVQWFSNFVFVDLWGCGAELWISDGEALTSRYFNTQNRKVAQRRQNPERALPDCR